MKEWNCWKMTARYIWHPLTQLSKAVVPKAIAESATGEYLYVFGMTYFGTISGVTCIMDIQMRC
jgi:adenosylmethionine-8-amino-7-oxononanoate aminotransferase